MLAAALYQMTACRSLPTPCGHGTSKVCVDADEGRKQRTYFYRSVLIINSLFMLKMSKALFALLSASGERRKRLK